MGWILVIGSYFSITAVGLVIGLLYPSFMIFVLKRNIKNLEVSELHSLWPLLWVSLISAAKCGLITFLILILLAFIASILFSTWAIGIQVVTLSTTGEN